MEVVLALSLLAVGLGLVFSLFFTASRSVFSGGRRHDLQRQASIILERVVTTLQAAPQRALSVAPSALSCASCKDRDGRTLLNPDGSSHFCAYEIFWLDAAAQELRYRRLDVPGSAQAGTPIEFYDDGSGIHPLSSYQTSGAPLTRNLTEFRCTQSSSDRVELDLTLGVPAQGQQAAQSLKLSSSVRLRL